MGESTLPFCGMRLPYGDVDKSVTPLKSKENARNQEMTRGRQD